MPLKTLVKVGSLTNLSDARYCAGMDVQMLGFQAIPDLPGHITPTRFQEIRGWVSGPSVVAEVHGVRSSSQLDSIIESYRPDFLELGLPELRYAAHVSLPLIVRLHPGESLDTAVPATYALIELNDIRSFPVPSIVRVSTLEDAQAAYDSQGVSGIALQGGEELSPGLKTYDTLAPILEMLEEDN
jgi:phosphoribosylanthranilate isomerase